MRRWPGRCWTRTAGALRLELASGFLSDRYDGEARALSLSEVVAGERSVAAIGIAAHEVSHALQDAEGSRVYRLRRTVAEPLARLSPWSGFLFIGGFWFGVPALIVLWVAYVAGLVLFALATLPVELGASRRALSLLPRLGPGGRRGGRRDPTGSHRRGAHVCRGPAAPGRTVPRLDRRRGGSSPHGNVTAAGWATEYQVPGSSSHLCPKGMSECRCGVLSSP